MINKIMALRSKQELGNAKFAIGVWIIVWTALGIMTGKWVGVHMPEFGAALIYAVVSLMLIGIVHFPRDNFGFYLLMGLGVSGIPFISDLQAKVGTGLKLILVLSFFYCCLHPSLIRRLLKKYGAWK